MIEGVSFTVNGKAEPRGSKTRTRWGVRDDNPKSGPFMEHVADVAAEAMDGRPLLEGPLFVELVFFRARPKAHFGTGRNAGVLKPAALEAWPETKPDLLKLARGVEDALTGVVYRDDAAIVAERLEKRFGAPARVEVTVDPIR
jgi:Holliday junction resolvase RusA-like endonuclease